MQMKKLSGLVAGALLVMTTSAHADISNYTAQYIVNDAVANGRVIYLSGSSATQPLLSSFAFNLFKLSGGTRFFFSNTTATTSSRDFEAVAGQLSSAASYDWPAGTPVIIVSRFKGGSVFGVDPVARATPIENLHVSNASCSGTVGDATTPFICSTHIVVSDAGISDVDPVLFQAPLNTGGEFLYAQPGLSHAELAEFDAPGYRGPIYALGYGYAFTNNLPNFHLTHAAVNGILSGNLITWDGVDPSLPKEDIVVCRLVPGSGTQAVFNMYNNNFPCDTNNTNPPVDRDSSTAWNAATRTYTVGASVGDGSGYVVIENYTPYDVKRCLLQAAGYTGSSSYFTKDRNGNTVTVKFSGPRKAIGLLSLDNMGDSRTAAVGWSFRSVNGAGKIHCDTACSTTVAPKTTGTGTFPTEANIENGTWDLQGHISMNIPKRTTGNKRGMLYQLLAEAQNPSMLDLIGTLDNVTAAVAVSGYTGTGVQQAKYLRNNQCAPYDKFQ